MTEQFALIVSGVFFANLLTIVFLWGIWHASRREKQEEPHLTYVLIGIAPLALMALVVHSIFFQ